MKLLVHGAQLQCDQGSSPSQLTVLPTNRGDVTGAHVATEQDFIPLTNIAPFGMCRSLANPQVAAATTLHFGILTPQPCVPVTTAPWTSVSSDVTLNGLHVLNDSSVCKCAWAGTICPASVGQDSTVLQE